MQIPDVLQIKFHMILDDLVLLSTLVVRTYMASRSAICMWTLSLVSKSCSAKLIQACLE